jgi:hypothetical protein
MLVEWRRPVPVSFFDSVFGGTFIVPVIIEAEESARSSQRGNVKPAHSRVRHHVSGPSEAIDRGPASGRPPARTNRVGLGASGKNELRPVRCPSIPNSVPV